MLSQAQSNEVNAVRSPIGTNRTNRADLMMSVPRGNPEVAFRGGQERF
jgi:hypothetical protein